MSDPAYAAFATALREGITPQREPAFLANTLTIGLLMAASTALWAYSLLVHWLRGTLWLVARRDGRLRLSNEHGPILVTTVFGAFWTALCIVWTVEAQRETAIVGSMALLVTCFAVGSFLLSALLLATDSFLPRDRSARWLRRGALVVYVLQPLTAVACIVAAAFIDSSRSIAIARLDEVVARLAAFEAAARPFEEAQVAIGPLLAEMAVVARRITSWSQGILGASTVLGCLWLAIYGPMSVMLAQQYDRRYQALRRGVKAAQTLERRGEMAVAAGGVVSAHLSSGAVDSGSRPFKGLVSHRQVVRTERLADLDRMATARRWLIVKTVTVLGVAVSFLVATCWLCVRSPHLTTSALRMYSITLFGWPYSLLALAAAGLSAYDARVAGTAAERALRGVATVQVDHVRIAVTVPPLPLDVGQGASHTTCPITASSCATRCRATFDSISPLTASWRPSDWSSGPNVPELIVTPCDDL